MRELFTRFVGPVIDKVLGLRCTSYGYQYINLIIFTEWRLAAYNASRGNICNHEEVAIVPSSWLQMFPREDYSLTSLPNP